MSKKKTNRGGYTAAKAKTGNGSLAVVKIVALLAVVIAVAYVITSLALGIRASAPVWNPLKWGKTTTATDSSDSATARTIAITSDGSAIKSGEVYELGRSATAVSGITYLSESVNNQTYVPDGEIIVTAELSNEYINGAFEWSVEFANPSSEWASGKAAEYYVSVEPGTNNSSSARLRYLEPFGEQIILTATLRGTDSSDSCTIDCLKKLVTTGSYNYYGDWGDDASFYISTNDTNYSLGTVMGEYKFDSAAIQFESNFISYVKNYLKFDIQVHSHRFYVSDVFKETSNGLNYEADCKIDMSMFIDGFDDFDTAHKEAIYYAWYNAWKYGCKKGANILVDMSFTYYYNGSSISSITETELPFSDLYCDEGAYIEPNTQLNQNYTF